MHVIYESMLLAQERDVDRAGNKLVDGFRDAADEVGDGVRNVGDRLTGRTVRLPHDLWEGATLA